MSRIIRAGLAVGLSIAALASSATTAHADQPTDAYASVRLRAEHSGKCLTIEDGRIGDGAYVVQQSCAEGMDNQVFQLRSSGQGWISIQAKHSGRCLGVDDNGDVKQLWCSDATRQYWRVMLVEVAKDLYELRPLRPSEHLCMIIPNSSQDDGVRPVIHICNGANNTRWRLEPTAS
ncbi:RICIN domain-containing protein [Streptomyces morookaense]|uniref:RICIN domain-containing protein n=1 Tax=Streptomyces morookaense TaxID=1970 RepID=A0A7Y7E7Z7_STRMO|nr:RICIN domain-containing protein [Streptomyces morookaense]NVK78916.1 RICIN domain-containing protein [Streptomyces morookaense]GHF36046.1 hypothetical protein GCM10010359_43520 [Streptomyces morookaense]